MTKLGETNNFSALDFTKEIEKYLGCELDFVIYNTKKPETKRLASYKKEHSELLSLVDFSEDLARNQKFIGKDILFSSGPIIHDSKKLIEAIKKICKL